MSSDSLKKQVLLSDYRTPPYSITHTFLHFDLYEDHARVHQRSCFVAKDSKSLLPLRLDGNELELLSFKVDGREQPPASYHLTSEALQFQPTSVQFELEITTRILPHKNDTLEGLYKSGGKFCTQCEAEGFRRITYFLDRPDVLATYQTTITADKKRYPVLLSNGNFKEQGDLSDGRHFATWLDPHPKPSYLFALVAGDLVSLNGTYHSKTGKTFGLRVFTEREYIDQCSFALDAMRRAMQWDEEVYGLAYDLDNYMVVAVNDFNMGAMENKGLNIFNAKFVVASPKTANDDDFSNIDSIIAHEYFHNWTGNRVTLRDWFQLSLKEGLTVYRDQQFSADITSRSVARIHNVRVLKERQFPEDRSAMAHPVRPESYLEINNFYTPTVYEKGAEIIRMMHHILGDEEYFRGISAYLHKFDGKAATIEDFATTMFSGHEEHLPQFMLWYSQPGTPKVTIKGDYDAAGKSFILTMRQEIPQTPATKTRLPMLIPIKTALFSTETGKALPLALKGGTPASAAQSTLPTELTLLLRAEEESFCFKNVSERAVPSCLRGFSAPVSLITSLGRDDLLFLMEHDTDGFNRYEVAQTLTSGIILDMARESNPAAATVDPRYIRAVAALLQNVTDDPLLLAQLLKTPTLKGLLTQAEGSDLDNLFAASRRLSGTLARSCAPQFSALYHGNIAPRPYRFDQESVGTRALKNLSLTYLVRTLSADALDLCERQYESADNMTETEGVLDALASLDMPLRDRLLADFYDKWQHNPLVLNKWFRIQAYSFHDQNLAHIKQLLKHPRFDQRNPNMMYAVFSLGTLHPLGLHHRSGEGYRMVADYVLACDKFNPSMAARLLNPFAQYKVFDETRKKAMREQIERIAREPRLSRDILEICDRSLTV